MAAKGLVSVFFKGLCLPVNPGGVVSCGFVILDSLTQKTITSGGSVIAVPGNTLVAEYLALVEAVKKAKRVGFKSVVLFTNCHTIITELRNNKPPADETVRSSFQKAKRHLESLDFWALRFIEGENNRKVEQISKSVFVNYVEAKNRDRAKRLSSEVFSKKDGRIFVQGYEVTLSPPGCSCLYFRQYNSLPLMRSMGITVKCKHILFVEAMVSDNSKQPRLSVAGEF